MGAVWFASKTNELDEHVTAYLAQVVFFDSLDNAVVGVGESKNGDATVQSRIDKDIVQEACDWFEKYFVAYVLDLHRAGTHWQ